MISTKSFVRTVLLVAIVSVIIAGIFPMISAVEPFGTSVSEIYSNRSPPDAPGNDSALAGNVTEMNLFTYSITQTWQGYFGNITGTIQLADGDDNVMYNWSALDPEGEVYATMNNSGIIWRNIQCFNYSAEGTLDDDSAQAGQTSLYGLNVSDIRTQFNINESDYDSINETFKDSVNHKEFYTANRQFSVGECLATNVYDNTGASVAQIFDEVLLYEPASRSVIFTSLIEINRPGFDSRTHDFEMLVLEDGHGTDVATTTYFFYVEIE